MKTIKKIKSKLRKFRTINVTAMNGAVYVLKKDGVYEDCVAGRRISRYDVKTAFISGSRKLTVYYQSWKRLQNTNELPVKREGDGSMGVLCTIFPKTEVAKIRKWALAAK